MVAIVTDVHYRMSLALVRDLGEAGVTVICCESNRFREKKQSPPLGALSKFCAEHRWLQESNYFDSLAEFCCEVGEKYACRPALLPVGARTLAGVAADHERFASVCGLLIPTSEQLDLFNSKERLAQFAAECSVPVPESYMRCEDETVEAFVKRISYPCVVKPICGEKLGLTASQRYKFADTETDAANAFNRYLELAGEDPVVQHRLMGGGLGLSVLAKGGEVIHAICHRRLREYPVTGGPSTCCRTENRPDLVRYVERLIRSVGYSGLAMFEFKEDGEGNPYLLEVNPRIWGTFPLTRVSRSGLPYLWCVMGWNVSNPQDPVEMPAAKQPESCKMVFTIADVVAAISYLRRGQLKKAIAAFVDFLNPTVRDGVFEWSDAAPGIAYFRSLFAREKHQ